MANSGHYVAIFGGAVSGAEAAAQLSQRGIRSVVFEQNALPYGKIEDGLPKWHVKLRDKEEQRINEKVGHPLVDYVPNVRLGKDVNFEEVAREWGFSAVLLATGAWKDRPLPVPGADDFVDKGLVYQNPFIYWFNHYHEPTYNGQTYEILDGTIVVGGGLASIDVVKVLMMESVGRALVARGHKVDLFTLDRSIAKVLDDLGLTLDDLGIKGCSLYYRRRVQDMPLSPMETDTPELLEKAERVREKILNNAQSKYLFHMYPLHAPVSTIVEDGRLAGLVFQQTEIDAHGKARPVEGSETAVRGPMVISSIGSLPEMIEGIPAQWGVYKVLEDDCCRIEGYDNAFALGNAVTGRGNINESLKHGRETTQQIIDAYLDGEQRIADAWADTEKRVADRIEAVATRLGTIEPLSSAKMEKLHNRVKRLQQATGYDGNYEKWVATHLPLRLEDMLGVKH